MTLAIQSAKWTSEDESVVNVTTPEGVTMLWAAHEGWPDFLAWQEAGGVVAPAYTINSATYSNEEGTSAILDTTESGAVAAYPERAKLWAQFEAWKADNPVAPFVPPEPEPDPEPL